MSKPLTSTVIGLGAMGWGAAVSLLRAGLPTRGVDIRPDVLARFDAEGGKAFASPADAVADADVVFVYVVNAAQAEAVLFGDNGAVTTARPGTIFANCVTVAPSAAIAIARRLEAAGMVALDTPVSGGAVRAAAGEITIMASGPSAAFDAIAPAIEAISARVFRLGEEVGTAARVKMINQLLAGVHMATAAEAITLAARLGIDLKTMHEVISASAGNSWMFENRGIHIVDGDYATHSAVDIFVKDLGIVRDEAAAFGFPTVITEAALSLFQEASAAGMGREDDAMLAKMLADKVGMPAPGRAPEKDKAS
ncbi:2-(hydroxymethyl)glutarate dehydrogenase [Hartmannibacter diazotrophicus]|uniref:L-threonate dehydrogenase n=1 Tax=Hartmannibacter diazotrophicus TaxID=1482074 RepID=A0A2C9D3D7_9HYPH|nr:L-threonate dehydrogenase [Hartmannibacter diazotrophicus]SON54784.1 2-(hydroxymethyl)glutarate dehydrogenase [Hartmannibacter diazotrophicus]